MTAVVMMTNASGLDGDYALGGVFVTTVCGIMTLAGGMLDITKYKTRCIRRIVLFIHNSSGSCLGKKATVLLFLLFYQNQVSSLLQLRISA